MPYTRSSQVAAEHEAAELSTVQGDPRYRYQAERYSDGRPGLDAVNRNYWPWGVARYELHYHKDGSKRFSGFVWARLPS